MTNQPKDPIAGAGEVTDKKVTEVQLDFLIEMSGDASTAGSDGSRQAYHHTALALKELKELRALARKMAAYIMISSSELATKADFLIKSRGPQALQEVPAEEITGVLSRIEKKVGLLDANCNYPETLITLANEFEDDRIQNLINAGDMIANGE